MYSFCALDNRKPTHVCERLDELKQHSDSYFIRARVKFLLYSHRTS